MEKNCKTKQKILQHTPLFHAVATEQIVRITEKSEDIRLAKGKELFHAGDMPNGFYIVAFGQIKLVITSPMGDEKIVDIISERQSFGEAVMFLDRPYPITAIALVDSLLLKIPLKLVDSLLAEDSSFAKRMLAGLSVRLHSLLQDVESYSMYSGAQRVISFLLLLCPEGCENSLEVMLPTSKLVIASRLNLTPETLSRVFHELTHNELIAVNGRQIQIPDLNRLREFMG